MVAQQRQGRSQGQAMSIFAARTNLQTSAPLAFDHK
jgi:hypothetical protein